MKNGYAVDKCHVSTLSQLWSTRNKSSTSAIFIACDNWEGAYLYITQILDVNRKEKKYNFQPGLNKLNYTGSEFSTKKKKKNR